MVSKYLSSHLKNLVNRMAKRVCNFGCANGKRQSS
nr:MAG TPA: Protein of unknown function (DUF1027) [Caudoviricetes sp.]